MPRREARPTIVPIEEVVAAQDERDLLIGIARTTRIVDVDPGVRAPFPSPIHIAETGITVKDVFPVVHEEEDLQTEADLRFEPLELLDVLAKAQRSETPSGSQIPQNVATMAQIYRESTAYAKDFADAARAEALALPEEDFLNSYARRIQSTMSQPFIRSALPGKDSIQLNYARTKRFYNRLLYTTTEYPVKDKLFGGILPEEGLFLSDGIIAGEVNGHPTVLYVIEHGLYEQDPLLLRQQRQFLELKDKLPEYFDYANFLVVVPDAEPTKESAISQTGDMTTLLEVPLDTAALVKVGRSIVQKDRIDPSSASLAEMRNIVNSQKQIGQVVIVLRDHQGEK